MLLLEVDCELVCIGCFAKCPPGTLHGERWLCKYVDVCVNCSEGCLFGFASESIQMSTVLSVSSRGVKDEIGVVAVPVFVVTSFRNSFTKIRTQSPLANSAERRHLSKAKLNHLSEHILSKIIITHLLTNILFMPQCYEPKLLDNARKKSFRKHMLKL